MQQQGMIVTQLPVGSSEFYDVFPSGDHQPGDIWTNFPTHGILGVKHVAGLVVTPACDLANRKVETITYLPIMKVGDYLCSRAFIADLIRATDGQLGACGMQMGLKGSATPLPPTVEDINAAVHLLKEYLAGSRLKENEKIAGARAGEGLKLIGNILTGAVEKSSLALVSRVLGDKEFSGILRRVVTNGFRSDIHFLPSDMQPSDWSAVRYHSVALFRYPMSLPIDLLDLALSTTAEGWAAEMQRWSVMYPCAIGMVIGRPLKPLRIRTQFIADLLTRYTNLYGRLGSPDFSDVVVERFVKEMGATQ